MLRVVFTFLLVMHGLAHVTGLLGHWTSGSGAFPDEPWLLSAGVVGLVGTGLGLVFKQAWWPQLAIAAAAVSLFAIVPWLKVVPPGAWAGALLDVLILVALLSPWAERIVGTLR
jgi:hypothetical protein